MKSLLLGLGLLATLTLIGPGAAAEPTADARALAVQLFDEAEALHTAGKTAEACPKYAESHRLDPQLGVLLLLSECYEANQQLASAWGGYREAEELGNKRRDPRAAQARERAKALESRLSYLIIDVPAEARLPGLQVLRDGVPVAEVLWSARAASDAGLHRVQVSAPGYQSWETQIHTEGEGGIKSVKVPKLKALPDGQRLSTDQPGAGSERGNTRRIAAIAVGGLGLAALGVGGFLGLSAQSSFSDSKGQCNGDGYCTDQGVAARSSAKNKATIATVATGVGVVAIAGAALLWFTAPSAPDRAEAKQARRWSIGPGSSSWSMEVRRAF